MFLTREGGTAAGSGPGAAGRGGGPRSDAQGRLPGWLAGRRILRQRAARTRTDALPPDESPPASPEDATGLEGGTP